MHCVHQMFTIRKIILIGWLMFLQIGKFNITDEIS